ncbi:MAG: polysaccharide deacetylase family protein [Flavobacteriales bacterium]|nr:polysaccharide deacetylase family protein [Flavobacteriales bacterium]
MIYKSRLYKWVYPGLIWQKKENQKKVYLTFDDGPNPEATEYVLGILDDFNFKATFFCIGDNVVKYPSVYQKVKSKGHAVGNHTHNHLNGMHTSNQHYISNIEEAAKHIESKLFRPPYGKISPVQIQKIKSNYDIIMWTCLSGDYKKNLDRKESLEILKSAVKPGAIFVFHDSLKSLENVKALLPEFCQYLVQNNFTSCRL